MKRLHASKTAAIPGKRFTLRDLTQSRTWFSHHQDMMSIRLLYPFSNPGMLKVYDVKPDEIDGTR